MLTVAPWRHGGSGRNFEWPAGAGNIIEDGRGIHKRGTGFAGPRGGYGALRELTLWDAGTKSKEPAGTPAVRGYQLLFLRNAVMWAT